MIRGIAHPLNRKLLRDLWHLKGQVLAIAVVIATGVGVLVMALGVTNSLEATADAYYERNRFADVFAHVKRAPKALARKIAALPGVQSVEPRIVQYATLDIDGFGEPATALLSSLPDASQPVLNRLTLKKGRLVDHSKPDQVIVNTRFAEAYGFDIGDTVRALINTQKRTLRIVGIALSPEHTYAIGPGQLMPDDKRYAIFWMGERALAGAFDLDGAFNDVTLTLLAGTDPEDVIQRLDRMLARYGGSGAYARKDQISNWFLMSEIHQLSVMARLLPAIFLAVAAFLTNMVINRLIATERGVIGLLKAFGYSDLEVGWHYMKLVMAIAGIGIALGAALGAALGHMTTGIYAEMYAFPFLIFRPAPESFAIAGGLSLAAAVLGTLSAVRRAVRLAPSEAMRAPAPPVFARSLLASSRIAASLDQPTRMIFRQIFRWPLRSSLTVLGIGMSVAVLVMALQWMDSIARMVDTYFIAAQRQDVSISLTEVRDGSVLRAFEGLPGVMAVEGERGIDVRLRFQARSKRLRLNGVPAHQGLNRVYDEAGGAIDMPPGGLVISSKLAEILNARVGDRITLEVLEGRRPTVTVPVVQIFETYIGYPAYMRLAAVNRLMREGDTITTVHLRVDPRDQAALFKRLKDTPYVSFVNLREAAITLFNDTMARTLYVFVGIFAGFAAALAVGVVYNSARIALSERGRELATLRVIGFTRFEISYILLGQSLALTLAALPVGCLLGTWLALGMAASFDTELYRVPAVIEPSSYGIAMLVTLAAAAVSALMVRRRLDRLDLIAVLKTRE
ncbi:FtsX-like permease family protein [Breoghania sp. L-A4]|uniref:ABC transporter permease n=1 Tax=Breoghania sp. L-A4 TaxID=2304600 RepID=UPI000E358746|nr:FtsX-like permease family protein [Breoghania sp. L-A4]AXS41388.1 ABC transporter permease [Breoghania sp. L-A4]